MISKNDDANNIKDGDNGELPMGDLFDSMTASFMFQTLNDAAIADRVIREQLRKGSKNPLYLWNSFIALRRTEPLREMVDDLYEYHCRELCERVEKGEDLDIPTDAEIIATLCALSERTPLSSAITSIYEKLFDKWREDKKMELWPHERDELGHIKTKLQRITKGRNKDYEENKNRKVRNLDKLLANGDHDVDL